MPNKSRRARLLAKKLRPETYTVAAKVRILGKRKDIICEPYIYMGDLSTQQLSYLPPFVQHQAPEILCPSSSSRLSLYLYHAEQALQEVVDIGFAR